MTWRADKWLVVLVVAALSTLSWWLPLRMGPAPPETPAVMPEARHVPDFFLREFELTSMDRAGEPRYRLVADGMTHYGDNDTADVSAPRMTLFRPAGPPWQGRSAAGWVATGGEMVRLTGEVVITRPGEVGAPGIELRSEEMRVWPEKEYAETELPVTLRDTLGVTQAVGLNADLKHDVLTLQSNVRGVYETP